jgi:hypothetical protein
MPAGCEHSNPGLRVETSTTVLPRCWPFASHLLQFVYIPYKKVRIKDGASPYSEGPPEAPLSYDVALTINIRLGFNLLAGTNTEIIVYT